MADIRMAVISDGIVVNVILAPEDFELEDFILVASDTCQVGDTYADGVFTSPVVEEPLPSPPIPTLIASGIFQVADGNVSYSGQPAGIGFAMQMDTGKFWLFFDDEQPDTSYAVYAGSSQGLVNYTDRQTTYFELSVTDGGAAIDPSEFSINVTVTRSI